MKLPPEIEFHSDIHLLVYRPRGILDESTVNEIVEFIEAVEERNSKTLHRCKARKNK